MIGIVNYEMGNLLSIQRKLERIKVSSIISDQPKELYSCDKLILPGVGHFAKAMEQLATKGLIGVLNDYADNKKKYILGICLGMQLMAKQSEEGNVRGLGWFDAEVIRFKIKNTQRYKVPHMGWNHVKIKKSNNLFDGVDLCYGFYFVHSYHIVCNDETDILTETEYETLFVSAIMKDNIVGMQYHPEKSHDQGEQLLKRFTSL